MKDYEIMDEGVMQRGSLERFCFKVLSGLALLVFFACCDTAPNLFNLVVFVIVLWAFFVIGLMSVFYLFRMTRRAIRGY